MMGNTMRIVNFRLVRFQTMICFALRNGRQTASPLSSQQRIYIYTYTDPHYALYTCTSCYIILYILSSLSVSLPSPSYFSVSLYNPIILELLKSVPQFIHLLFLLHLPLTISPTFIPR